MTTIRHFERALGPAGAVVAALRVTERRRRASTTAVTSGSLRIYPHALREANAYYSPAKKALLFGYFPASATDPGRNLPGGMVFTCLSHDIIAHETTHALLDGMHRRLIEPTNPDVLAFHEAFADIVALFQHFTFPEVLRHQIAGRAATWRSRTCSASSPQQFGQAIGATGALRERHRRSTRRRTWEPTQPDRGLRDARRAARARRDPGRGGVRRLPRDLQAPGSPTCCGSRPAARGVLPRRAASRPGQPPGRARPASPPQHVLHHVHPRARLLPAGRRHLRRLPARPDHRRRDLVPDDDLGYRVAFIEAFPPPRHLSARLPLALDRQPALALPRRSTRRSTDASANLRPADVDREEVWRRDARRNQCIMVLAVADPSSTAPAPSYEQELGLALGPMHRRPSSAARRTACPRSRSTRCARPGASGPTGSISRKSSSRSPSRATATPAPTSKRPLKLGRRISSSHRLQAPRRLHAPDRLGHRTGALRHPQGHPERTRACSGSASSASAATRPRSGPRISGLQRRDEPFALLHRGVFEEQARWQAISEPAPQ